MALVSGESSFTVTGDSFVYDNTTGTDCYTLYPPTKDESQKFRDWLDEQPVWDVINPDYIKCDPPHKRWCDYVKHALKRSEVIRTSTINPINKKKLLL